jgi:hypothetical protein
MYRYMAQLSMAKRMNDNRSKRDSKSIDEATVSNIWEIAAIVEVLEREGLCTK